MNGVFLILFFAYMFKIKSDNTLFFFFIFQIFDDLLMYLFLVCTRSR